MNWVTQTAFVPPLVVAGVKADSGAHAALKTAGVFAVWRPSWRRAAADRPRPSLEMKDLGDNVLYGG
jgi:hypothetical protein